VVGTKLSESVLDCWFEELEYLGIDGNGVQIRESLPMSVGSATNENLFTDRLVVPNGSEASH
jgi:hypothetical protein